MLTKRLQRIGNSIGVILPRDLVDAADLDVGDEVTITLHGRRLVIEPSLKSAEESDFRAAFEAVLARHGEAFRKMAEYDRSPKPRRGR